MVKIPFKSYLELIDAVQNLFLSISFKDMSSAQF